MPTARAEANSGALVRTATLRRSIGARIRVEVEESGRTRTVHAVVNTGGTFGSSSLQQEIGLGKAETVRSVTVEWPGGEKQVLRNPPLDRFLHVVQGSADIREETRPRVELRRGTALTPEEGRS